MVYCVLAIVVWPSHGVDNHIRTLPSPPLPLESQLRSQYWATCVVTRKFVDMDTYRLTVFIFTLFCACFGRENKRNCDPGPFIEEHEGRKACVYLNYKRIKTIGVGYNMQNPNALEDFRSIDADYDKFNNGPTTPWNVKCNCSAVPCLLDAQTNKLFALTLTAAVSDAQKFISNFAALCCPVQNVVVDMAFTFGIERLYELEEFASLIEEQYWKAAADYLSISKWCLVEAQKRCSEDAAIVNKGCGCFGPYPQACDARASTCCGPKSEMTCCKGKQFSLVSLF